jgi:hypothetical protein
MFMLITSSFLITSYLFIIIYFKLHNYNNANSIINILHSVLISTSCLLYINNLLSFNLLLSSYYIIIGFFIFDILFILKYNNRYGLTVKLIHHTIAIIGILAIYYAIDYDTKITEISCKLFITEIVNIPVEIRLNALRNNYTNKYIQEISEYTIYLLFLVTRIIYPIQDLKYVCTERSIIFCFDYIAIYALWCFWFIIINYKFYNKFKQKMKLKNEIKKQIN